MTASVTTFWQLMNQLRATSYDRLDLLSVLKQAREHDIPVTLADVRRLVTLQKHEGLFLSEAFITEFITAYLRHQQIDSLLDPFASIGGFIGPVAQTLNVEQAIGLNIDPRMGEVARLIHEGVPIEWRVGNPSVLLADLNGTFDAIIGCPPLGMPRLTQTLDVQGQSISLHDEAGRITAAQALRLLDAQGVALLLTTPNFLWTADLRSVGAQIEQLGVYLDAALLIR